MYFNVAVNYRFFVVKRCAVAVIKYTNAGKNTNVGDNNSANGAINSEYAVNNIKNAVLNTDIAVPNSDAEVHIQDGKNFSSASVYSVIVSMTERCCEA